MSVWSRLVALAHAAFDPEVHPEPGGVCAPDPGDVGFTAAVVGLAAKMARADGAVTRSEEEMFAKVFPPPPGEEAAFARVFALARETVHGFESYARQIGKRYASRPCLLEDVLDGLFAVACADGAATRPELELLNSASVAFGLSEMDFIRVKAAWLGPDPNDPWAVLGLPPGTPMPEVDAARRRFALENHPDAIAGRGAPPEFVRKGAIKMSAVNAAYARIKALSAANAAAS
jgi:DnaJ like chaperone protein